MKKFTKQIILLALLAIIVAVVLVITFTGLSKTVSVTQIQNQVNALQHEMNLDNWRIKVEEKDLSTVPINSDSKGYEHAVAEVSAVPAYLSATIYVDKNHLKDVTKHALMHEMYHIHYSEMRNYVLTNLHPTPEQQAQLSYYEERFVESITRSRTR